MMMTLTPNQRLARAAREKHDLFHQAKGNTAWPSLAVYPLPNFITQLWEKLVQAGVIAPAYLLTTSQRNILWQSILSEQDNQFSCLYTLAIKAWETIHAWNFNLEDNAFCLKEETRYFQQCALRYKKLLTKNNWSDTETIFSDILILLNNNLNQNSPQNLKSFLPAEIILLGFTDFSAREKKLWDLLKASGVKITQQYYTHPQPDLIKLALPDEHTEIDAAAQWAYQSSLAGKKTACVFPHLSAEKNKILAVFQRYFDNPQDLNISLGNPLSTYDLIKAGLTALSLNLKKIEITSVSAFLLSPYFKFPPDLASLSARALLDKKLHAQSSLMIETNYILKKIHINPSLFKKSDNRFYSPSEWASFFAHNLADIGFLKARPLDSKEYQLAEQWQILMENFSHLSVVLNKINLTSALFYLNNLADNMTFQAKRSARVKVEILGMLEAAGLAFDAVWIAGLHDNAWPPKTKPHPFLPFSVAARNKIFYQKAVEQLLSSAKKIILSHPKTVKDISVIPSFFLLLPPIPEYSVHINLSEFKAEKTVLKKIKLLNNKNYKNNKLEIIDDFKAPIVDIHTVQHKSSEIIKDQAACPFRAFVKHRLGVKKIESPELGFKAVTKGNFVHQILEKIFTVFPDQESLIRSDTAELTSILQHIIQQVLNAHHTAHTGENNPLFLETEKKRLEILILDWLLNQEIKRKPFTVLTREEKIDMQLGDLPLSLRIDRIDKINQDYYIIIDYKTGKTPVKINALDEPQLPLYCIAKADLPIQEAAIAQIRPNDMRFKPVSAQTEYWKTLLLPLAQSYLQGMAIVNPRHGDETCRFCGLMPVCRIKEVNI